MVSSQMLVLRSRSRPTRRFSREHCVLTAGFWNAHIHFTEPKWSFAVWKRLATLNSQLVDMLTSRGFTNVVDTGWDLRVTLSLRRRIESGELLGYLYSWVSVVPAEGDSLLLEELRACLHYLADAAARDAAEAAAIEERNIARGADLLKLLTGS